MAASALAIGLSMGPAQSLPLGGEIASADAMVQQVQRSERGGGELGYRERRERGYGERDRDRRRGGFYFGVGPDGPSFGYGRQPRRDEFGYRERRERGYDRDRRRDGY
jgi:hypothetical protein